MESDSPEPVAPATEPLDVVALGLLGAFLFFAAIGAGFMALGPWRAAIGAWILAVACLVVVLVVSAGNE